MGNIAFRSFTWNENPTELKVESRRQALYGLNDSGKYGFLGLGPTRRVVTGKGVFSGNLASEQFSQLEALLTAGVAGTFTDPDGETMTGYLMEAAVTRDSRPGLVEYTFTFQETDANGDLPE